MEGWLVVFVVVGVIVVVVVVVVEVEFVPVGAERGTVLTGKGLME